MPSTWLTLLGQNHWCWFAKGSPWYLVVLLVLMKSLANELTWDFSTLIYCSLLLLECYGNCNWGEETCSGKVWKLGTTREESDWGGISILQHHGEPGKSNFIGFKSEPWYLPSLKQSHDWDSQLIPPCHPGKNLFLVLLSGPCTIYAESGNPGTVILGLEVFFSQCNLSPWYI